MSQSTVVVCLLEPHPFADPTEWLKDTINFFTVLSISYKLYPCEQISLTAPDM